MAHDVFISYASSDKAVADAVCSQLESLHRIRCWIAPRDITPGASWAESIIDALDASKIMVLIFSSSANASMQIEREVERAVHKGINIIPLRIENTTPTKTLEYFISAPHWLDALSVPLEQHIGKLAVSVQALRARPGAAGRVAPLIAAAAPAAAVPAALPGAVPGGPRPVAAAQPAPPRRSNSILYVALGVVLTGAAFLAESYFLSSPASPASSPDPDLRAEAAATHAPTPAAGVETAGAGGQPSPAATPGAPDAHLSAAADRAPAALPGKAPAQGAAAPDTSAADPKPPARLAAPTPRAPNLYIDFRNPISEGSLEVSIDGHKQWSASLAPPTAGAADGAKREPTKEFTQPLAIPAGAHKVEVVLLRADGKARDTQQLDMALEAAAPRTLRSGCRDSNAMFN